MGVEELKWRQLAHHRLMSQLKDLTLVHTVQLKPMIKAHFSGRMAYIGICDIAFASVHSDKTRLKKLMMIMIIIKLEQKILLKNEKRCRVAYSLKNNENKGDLELTLSQKTNNSLKTDKYMTAIAFAVNQCSESVQ